VPLREPLLVRARARGALAAAGVAVLSLVFAATVEAAPPAPVITEPATDAQYVHPADVHMEVAPPANPDDDACTDWEIRTDDPSQQIVWHADCKTGVLAVHIHLGDGSFTDVGRTQLDFDSHYVLRARFKNTGAELGDWAERRFNTDPPSSPGGAVAWTALRPGYVVDEVAGNLRLPTDIAFVPNPGAGAKAPVLYVTELYGSIEVITRDGSIQPYATGLLDFNPTGDFPGSGEMGVTGIVVDPSTGDVFAALLHDSDPSGSVGELHPQVVRLHSADGGLTAGDPEVIKNIPEPQGPSHQISNLTIGPDYRLYVHMGDGFDSSKALNLDSYRGKILRMNLDGSAPPDNPFYSAVDGINARDYIYAYGFRNPFGGAWRANPAHSGHYEVENGPAVDRLARVDPGAGYGWDDTDASMATNALYNWSPSHAPVNLAFVQQETFGGSGFPTEQWDHAFVTESGPTYATGPQTRGKRIVEFDPDPFTGEIGGHPHTLVEYTGTGKATAVGLAAGPDGLYFTDLYKDQKYSSPIDCGARLLRVRYDPGASASTGTEPALGTNAAAGGSVERSAPATKPCIRRPQAPKTDQSEPLGATSSSEPFNLEKALRHCRRKFPESKKRRARCVRQAKRDARAARS
jgi:glucose/arabinose dehydrogenase